MGSLVQELVDHSAQPHEFESEAVLVHGIRLIAVIRRDTQRCAPVPQLLEQALAALGAQKGGAVNTGTELLQLERYAVHGTELKLGPAPGRRFLHGGTIADRSLSSLDVALSAGEAGRFGG